MTTEDATAAYRAVRRYVAVLCAFGGLGTLALAQRLPTDGVNVEAAVTLSLATLLAIWTPLRVHGRGGVQGFTLEVAVFVALLFAVPTGIVPLLYVSAAAIAHALLRRGALKMAYNVGHAAAMVVSGTTVFVSIGATGDPFSGRSLIATLVATATFEFVDVITWAELMRRLERRSWWTTIRDVSRLRGVTWVGNTSFGLILAFVAMQNAFATVLASTLMVGLYLGYRGYAGVLEERTRTERLHALTRTLIDVTSSDESMQRFLEDLRSVTGAEGAALLLQESHDLRRVVRDGTAVDDVSPCPYLSAALQRGEPVLVTGVAGDDAKHRDAIAAPVTYEGRTVGAIAVYDRYGLEPWDDTDATLLGTIANEAAVAIKNVELFTAVERERALLAEESRKLSDIVDNASDGIAMVEADGRVAAWNDAMATITGLGAGDTFGRPWFTVLRLRDTQGRDLVPEGDNALAAALRGHAPDQEIELQVLRRDGAWRWIRCSVSTIERSGPGVVGAVLLARDVTREREVDGLKSDFVATVSHELRTPLTPLRGFLDTMLAKGDKLTPDQTETILRSMRGQVSRLERLVGDLLVVADVDRRALGLRVEAHDLVGLIPDALARVQPEPAAGRLTVDAPEWLGAVCDEPAVVRIVSSLIDNAAKHTEGAIRVRLYREGEDAVVEVSDDGPGIAPWDHDVVFRRFGRLGDHLHRTQGPGLGLPIARALAQSLGGEVTLQSDVGRGATFRLRLPASAPRAVRQVDEPGSRTSSA